MKHSPVSVLSVLTLLSGLLPSVHARVLVQDSFPVGGTGYSSAAAKLNASANNFSGTGIVGFATGWTTGSNNTGVFWCGPASGLSFPSGILRTAEGAGAAYFSHGQSSEVPNDYGRILGRQLDSSSVGVHTEGVLYMSLLVKSADQQSLDLLAEGHWRMMGVAASCYATSDATLMQTGVYLGVAKVNGQAVNALKVGTSLLPISAHVPGTTYFLLARIDLDNLVVHAREITSSGATDTLSEYVGSLPINAQYAAGLLTYLNIGGDYAVNNTLVYFDELRVSTLFAEQVGYANDAYTVGDIAVTAATETSLSCSIGLLAAGTGGTLIVDCINTGTGETNDTATVAPPVVGDNAVTLSGLLSGTLYRIVPRIEVGGNVVSTGAPVTSRTAGDTTLPDTVLLQESFPLSASAYSANGETPLRGYASQRSGTGIQGVASGWANGDTGTGVFSVDPVGGLSFPSGILREPLGAGAVAFHHAQSTEKPDDFGRILGCLTMGTVSGSDMVGVYYMSLLVRTSATDANTLLSDGHWRMTGVGPSCVSDSTPTLMNNGVYLGVAKVNGTVMNALKVGSTIVPISTNAVGTTHFLLARIDFNEGTVYAREITDPRVSDTPEDYPASVTLTGFPTANLFRYFLIGGDYALNNQYVHFDEFLLSTRFSHHTGIASGVYTIADVSVVDVTTTSAAATVSIAGLGSGGTLCLDVIDTDSSVTNTLSIATPEIGDNSFSLSGLSPATFYTLRAYVLVGGEPESEPVEETFHTTGIPVLEDLASESTVPEGETISVLRISVTLAEPGITGTTVELLAGSSANDLAVIGTFGPTSVAASYTNNATGFALGSTIYYAARATCVYEGSTISVSTPVESATLVGTDAWLNTTGDESWHTADNWSQRVIPTAGINANITEVGGDITAAADMAASNLLVQCGTTPVTLTAQDNTLSTTTFRVGANERGILTLRNVRTATDSLRIGGAGGSRNSRLTIDRGRIDSNTTVIGNANGTHGPNHLFVTNGAAAALGAVTLGLPTVDNNGSHGNHVVVSSDCNVSFSTVNMCPGGDNTFFFDHANVYGHGAFTLTSRTGGNGTGTNTVTLANMSQWDQFGSDLNFGWYNGRLYVLDGSILHVGTMRLGYGNDQGSGNLVVVSNAVLTASNLLVPGDNRFRANALRVYNDPGVGSNTTVQVAENLQIGVDSARTGNGNQNNRFLLRGGAVSAKWVLVGGSSPDDTGNVLDIADATSSIYSQWFTMRNDAALRIAIPRDGFAAEALLDVWETVNIGSDATLEVDTTAARSGRYVLFRTPTIAGNFDATNISITRNGSQRAAVVTEQIGDNYEIVVYVRPTGTLVVFQ